MLPEVINGIVFCTLAKTVVLHVQEASRKRWSIPALTGPGADSSQLAITDMIPYWMDPTVYTPRVVPNSVRRSYGCVRRASARRVMRSMAGQHRRHGCSDRAQHRWEVDGHAVALRRLAPRSVRRLLSTLMCARPFFSAWRCD
eukprot:3761770-Rhodomonas_salina.2